MKKSAFLYIAAAIVVAGTMALSAEDAAKTKSISVFKNGLGYFVKEMKVNVNDGKYVFEKLPVNTGFEPLSENTIRYDNTYAPVNPVLFGTIWFAAPNNTIKTVKAYDKKTEKPRPFKTMAEFIEANIGKTGNVKLSNFEKPFPAKILKVDGQLVILEKDSKWMVTELIFISNFELNDQPVTEFKDKDIQKTIELEFEKSASNQEIDVLYMQKGITWAPNYLVELLDDSKARITLRASLLNDIEDIENAGLNFVVGVPSFKFSNIESPLLSHNSVANFLTGMTGYGPGSADLNIMSNARQGMITQAYDYAAPSPAESYSVSIDNSQNEELFLYRMDGVSLKKGGRALYSIAQLNTDYENLYSVELPRNFNFFNAQTRNDHKNDVWRSIKFKNESKIPFTTGTCFITKLNNGISEPVSQNELKYTPVGGSNEVKMTIAPDILVTDSEKETDRAEKAKQYTYWYDEVTMEGKIEIKNYKDKDIKIKIYRTIDGELVKSNEDWESEQRLSYNDAKNKCNDVYWEIEVDANETNTITYTYKILVQR